MSFKVDDYNVEFPSWAKDLNDPLCKEAYENPEFDPAQILKAVYLNPNHTENWNVCYCGNRVLLKSGYFVYQSYKNWFNEYLRRAIVFYYRGKPDTFTYDIEPVPMMTHMICECKERGDEKNKYYKYFENVKLALQSFYNLHPKHYS